MTRWVDPSDVRELLGQYDHHHVTVTYMEGQVETTDYGDSIRSFADNGDRALVFLGPLDKMPVERRAEEDGTIVYTVRIKPER